MRTPRRLFHREPIYRALASMPPLAHWPNRNQPFDAANSLVIAFIRGAAAAAGTVLEPGEDLEILQSASGPHSILYLIKFDEQSGKWHGSGITQRLDKRIKCQWNKALRKAKDKAKVQFPKPEPKIPLGSLGSVCDPYTCIGSQQTEPKTLTSEIANLNLNQTEPEPSKL